MYSPRNDPDPELIPDPEMIPKPARDPEMIPSFFRTDRVDYKLVSSRKEKTNKQKGYKIKIHKSLHKGI